MLGLGLLLALLPAQGRLPELPGYARYQEVGAKIRGAWRSGEVQVRWLEDGRGLEFQQDGQNFHYDVAAGRLEAAPPAAAAEGAGANAAPGRGRGRGGRGGPERGRQFDEAPAPDGKRVAFYRERNLWLREADGKETRITSEGSASTRVKFATASWVYGEELGQTSAMWWSPDGGKIAFYRFDESACLDYYLALEQTAIQSKLDVEAYPKAGAPNPVADLLIYDLGSKRTVKADVRGGKEFGDAVVGHYVYGVSWSPNGEELLFHRADRLQQVMEFAACNPRSGKCRTIVREEWPDSWTSPAPEMRWLADGKRFVWASERTGWRNYYLYEVSGKLLAALTRHEFEVAGIERVDEKAGVLWYMARSGDNPLKLQLHRVGLDGKDDVRLTDPALHHAVDLAPDGRHFADVAQTHELPPTTRLCDAEGRVIATLANSDLGPARELGLKPVEMFQYVAADGATPLWGMLHFPSDFDPARQYPLLLSVYAGPGSGGATETFGLPQPLTEYGFLFATLDARSAGGRGKRALDAIYGRLGVVEIDDLAAGVRALGERPYVNRARVGIFGTSYGGYAAVMALLRHPECFAAACASSAVTDWRNYDSIYTERYMGLPQQNAAGYDAGSAMRYAKDLAGRLLLYYGTADNNVHPANSLQLIAALQAAGKSFEVQVGPDRGHSGLGTERMMEFFIESLVLR